MTDKQRTDFVVRPPYAGPPCATCGVAHPFDNVFCSDGFHAPPDVMTPDPTLIEQIADVIRNCTDADTNDANYAARLIATLQGSAALPSEALIKRLPSILPPAADVDERYLEGWVDAMVYAQGCLRATTPTAPDQDMGALSGSHASTEPCGLGPSGFDPARVNLVVGAKAWAKFNRCPEEDMPLDRYMQELARRLNDGCDIVDGLLAIAMEARSVETEGLHPEDDSADLKGIAHD